jgi:hypothetical protein
LMRPLNGRRWPPMSRKTCPPKTGSSLRMNRRMASRRCLPSTRVDPLLSLTELITMQIYKIIQ